MQPDAAPARGVGRDGRVRQPVAGPRSAARAMAVGDRQRAALIADRQLRYHPDRQGDETAAAHEHRDQRGGERYPPGPQQRGNLAGARLGPERQVGQAEHLAGHRAALRFVGIEQQRIAGRRRGGESQLPAEVGRILDGGVHSLAGGGRVGVRRVPGDEQPPAPELVGDAALYPDPRGPGHVGDRRRQARAAQQCPQLIVRDRRAWLPERQPGRPGGSGPGEQQPPGGLLAEPESECDSRPPRHDVRAVAGEVAGQLDVSEQDLHRVGGTRPPDA